MGHVVKSVFGGGGSSKSTSKETANSNNQSESWLMKNPTYTGYLNSAINEAANYNTPQYQLAGENQNITDALNNLAHGVDTSGYKNAQEFMSQLGNKYLAQGEQGLNSAQGLLNQYQNMSQSDYQNMMKSEFNSDLVNEEINQLKGDVNEQYQGQVQALNQQAGASGNMGNSRAGVAQGRMAEAADKAVASGSASYRAQEEQNAYGRLQGYLNTRFQAANSQIGVAQSQMNAGYQAYNQGMNYLNQFNQATTQNYQNQLTAGNYQRQYQQQQLDVNRQNQLLQQSPALQRLLMLNGGMLPVAGLQQFGTNSGTSNTTSTQPSQGGGLLSSFMGMAGQGLGQWMQPQQGFGSYFNMGQMGGAIGGAFGNAWGG